ncbi:MAG: amidohydrolase family protein, partial [Actinomycetota bacterium]|nr:amidohydrolase family protein [Actinomycetota bacterium]
MRTLITIREPGSEPVPIVVDGDRFSDPDDGPIDHEIKTDHLYALPGLADCHAHLGLNHVGAMTTITEDEIRANSVTNAWMQVEGGVLLIADKGSSSDVSLEILDAPPTERPIATMAGRIIAPRDGYYPDYGHEVDEEGLVEAVRQASGGRAEWVKIIGDWPRRGRGTVANYGESALTRAVEVAHAAGRRVAVHTMAPEGIGPAVVAGVDSIEHGLFLAADDLPGLAERGGAWVPTILAAEAIIEMLGADSTGGRLLARGVGNVRDLLPEAERLGVTILTGTDLAIPHGKVAHEAIRLNELGLPREAAFRAVSAAAFDYLGIDHGFSPGMPADAVFFADNPREHLETLLDPQVIIRSGR